MAKAKASEKQDVSPAPAAGGATTTGGGATVTDPFNTPSKNQYDGAYGNGQADFADPDD